MIFDRGAETVLPFFRATDIARELKNVIENVGIGAELIAAEITDEMLAPFTDTGLSNGKVGMDNDSDVFSKKIFSWMKIWGGDLIYPDSVKEIQS